MLFFLFVCYCLFDAAKLRPYFETSKFLRNFFAFFFNFFLFNLYFYAAFKEAIQYPLVFLFGISIRFVC